MGKKDRKGQVVQEDAGDHIMIIPEDIKKLWNSVAAIDLVTENIFEYLGLKDSLAFSETNKGTRISLHRLFRSTTPIAIDAHMIESVGKTLCSMLDYLRLSVNNDLSCATISSKANKYLMQSHEANGLRQIGCHEDLLMLNSQLWTYWDRTPSDPDLGLLKILQSVAANNEPVREAWETAIERDVKYWKNARVHGLFYVLFERPDGTILASEDMKRFYLVLGQAQSLGTFFKQHPKAAREPKAGTEEVCIHARVIGDFMIETTLLPWYGNIVYDGLLTWQDKSMSKGTERKLLQGYQKAWNEGKIIKSLELKEASDITPLAPSPSSRFSSSSSRSYSSTSSTSSKSSKVNSKEIERYSLENSTTLLALSKAPLLPDFKSPKAMNWTLRRHGYSEFENPHHLVGVLETAVDGSGCNFLVPAYHCKKLAPTVPEYLEMLTEAVKARRGQLSAIICIDVESVIEPLQALFELFNIKSKIHWYAPPSSEETNQLDAKQCGRSRAWKSPTEYPECCTVCRARTQAGGEPLLTCGQCKVTLYCGREHQKLHWKVHKKSCSK